MELPRKLFRIQPNLTIYEFSLRLSVFLHWSNHKYSLVFIKPNLPSTLLQCFLLFKQISLSTAPHINQTNHHARNYLSSVIPIYSLYSPLDRKSTRLNSLNLIIRGKNLDKMDTTFVTFKKGRFGNKNFEHGTSQKTLSHLAEPYHL